jgi:hypothetical protein
MIGNAIRLSKVALPGPHSPLTPENASSMLAPNGHRARTPPAWHEERKGGTGAGSSAPKSGNPQKSRRP